MTAAGLSIAPSLAPSGLEGLVDDYLASCRARGLSPRTLSAYGRPLQRVFLRWAREHGVERLEQLDQRTLDRYTSDLLERTDDDTGTRLSRYSVAAYVRPLRQLIEWARRQGEAVGAGKPQLPRLPRRLIEVLTLEEIDRLEQAAVHERDRLIIRLLADTGMRAGELVALELDDLVVRGQESYLRVCGKGHRERLVPISTQLRRRLQRYLQTGRPDADKPPMFISLRQSRHGGFAPLTTSGVAQILEVASASAGLKARHIHPHALRHAFVTNALRGGMNPLLVQQIVGHSSLRMIESVYSHLTTSDSHRAMMQLLARARE